MKQRGIRICIVGSEVLNGFIADTNSGFFCREFFKFGYTVKEIISLPDDANSILETWERLAESGDLIINSGGLGPTSDDLTVDLVCKWQNLQPVFDERSERKVQHFFSHKYSGASDNVDREKLLQTALRQARIPEHTRSIRNGVGLAQGFFLEKIPFIAVPGFPIEIESMWVETLEIISGLSLYKAPTRILPVWGVGESHIFSAMNLPDSISLGVHSLPLGSQLFGREIKPGGMAELDCLFEDIRKKYPGTDMKNPIISFLEFLMENKMSITGAESCTGGLAAKLITDMPGSSAIFKGSYVTYSDAMKVNILGVSESTLQKQGAVSQQTAIEMAIGAIRKNTADFTFSITGIAGPSGGSREKPVGTVCIAFGRKDELYSGTFEYPYGRERFRNAAVYTLFLAFCQRYMHSTEAIVWENSFMGKKFRQVPL